ncbi:MAG: hypothetical protein Q4F35_02905 [Akkermansia sp.]|nr:hypothetical protein [Akkermansia sp.]
MAMKMTGKVLAKSSQEEENAGVVNESTRSCIRPIWQLFSLWGLDVVFAALCWSVVIAAHFKITMLTVEPLLVVCALIWFVVMYGRMSRALKSEQAYESKYYRSHLAPLVPIGLAVVLAAGWILFFHVGKYFIYFLLLPFLPIAMSTAPLLRRCSLFILLFSSMGFVFACAAPAYFYSYSYTPLSMLFSAPLWVMVGMFFLFGAERHKRGDTSMLRSVMKHVCLLSLFLVCCIKLGSSPAYIRGFYITITAALAALHVLSRLRKRLPENVWSAIGWTMMALPALLGILIFAPEEW